VYDFKALSLPSDEYHVSNLIEAWFKFTYRSTIMFIVRLSCMLAFGLYGQLLTVRRPL
jgi:hypothetical protein